MERQDDVGGSVYFITAAFDGSGVVRPDGMDALGGALGTGGGGRVAFHYHTNTFTGTLSAAGPDDAEDGTVGLFDESDPQHIDLRAGTRGGSRRTTRRWSSATCSCATARRPSRTA